LSVLPFLLLVVALRLHGLGSGLLSVVNLSVCIISAGIAVLLLLFNHSYSVIRQRTRLPAIFFLLMTGTEAHSFTGLTACMLALIIMFCLMSAFAAYQKPDAAKQLFNISLLLSAGSLLWPPSILLLPLFWVAFIQFKAFGRRSFSASLTGIFVVLLSLFAWGAYVGDPGLVWEKMPHFDRLFEPDSRAGGWQPVAVARMIFTGALLAIALVYLLTNLFSEKVKTQSFFLFLYLFIAVIMAGIVFTDGEGRVLLLPTFYLLTSMLVSHLFTLSDRKTTGYLLAAVLVFYTGSYLIDGW
jgi:hypothetical protein